VRFGILDKTSFPEVPPRVEYDLTAFGMHFITLINQIDELQQTLERTTVQRSGNAKSR
jgi:DNA-binding HxlR family transcriptional regulator